MRIDHLAFRVRDRQRTAQFFIEAFGYRIQTEFEIEFDDGSKAKCLALEPSEKKPFTEPFAEASWPWTWTCYLNVNGTDYHMAPEIFVSDGLPGSIVGDWVAARGGIGGLHHIAYQVESVEQKMQEWREKGYAEFTSDKPLTCPGLTQVFTKPSELTGVIYEFIERGAHGFCANNVKELMLSTKGL